MRRPRSVLKIRSLMVVFGFQLSNTTLAQTKPEDLGLTAMQVTGETGVINFYVSADPSKNPPKKPLFVFLQGSQPRPILQVQRAADGSSVTKSILLFVFELPRITGKYHYVALGKRGLPFIADTSLKTPPRILRMEFP